MLINNFADFGAVNWPVIPLPYASFPSVWADEYNNVMPPGFNAKGIYSMQDPATKQTVTRIYFTAPAGTKVPPKPSVSTAVSALATGGGTQASDLMKMMASAGPTNIIKTTPAAVVSAPAQAAAAAASQGVTGPAPKWMLWTGGGLAAYLIYRFAFKK